jgi:hypothetical protein
MPRHTRTRRSRMTDAEYYSTLPQDSHPTDPISAGLYRRFRAEPESPELTMVINGETIILPKYNGVGWFFPTHHDRSHPLENFFAWFFTVVNTVQTSSLCLLPAILLFRFGFLYTFLSLPLTVPLASHLEDKYGSNYGTAYSSLNTLYLSFFAMRWLVSSTHRGFGDNFDPNPVIFVISFVALIFLVGNTLCIVENLVFGRTWFAALIAYAHVLVWIRQAVV